MSEDVTKLNLVQKLAMVRSMSGVVGKDKKGYGYTYADIASVLAGITAGMKKYHVSLIPKIVPGSFKYEQLRNEKVKFAKDGTQYTDVTYEVLIDAEMEFQWINDDNLDETILVPWHLVGSQSDPSQAFGSALTYCTRYFLIDYFQIATVDNDVDAYRSKQKEAEAQEDKAIAEALIKEFDDLIKDFLANNGDKKEEIKDFCGKYAKNSDYNKIKDSKTAARILNDFKAIYLNEKPSEEPAEGNSEPTKATKKKGE